MKNTKPMMMLILLCTLGISRTMAQLGWAREFDLPAAISGTYWTEVKKVIKTSDDKYVVAGTTNGGAVVVAKFGTDGVPLWLHELRVPVGAVIRVTDLAESKDASAPGYAICGQYNNSRNYLARLDGSGNLLWDRIWNANGFMLTAVIFSGVNNDIVTTGTTVYSVTSLNTVAMFRLDNSGSMLFSKMVSSDYNLEPVDILEDPSFNTTGGFFVLAQHRQINANLLKTACLFFDNALNYVTSFVIQLPSSKHLYDGFDARCFVQDQVDKNLYILANVNNPGSGGRTERPTVVKINPSSITTATAVLQAPAFIPNNEAFHGTDIMLVDGVASKGLMVTANHIYSGRGAYTWNMNTAPATLNLVSQWLNLPDMSNMSLCVSADDKHYLLAGQNLSLSHLTLNTVDLNGDKVNVAGSSQCIDRKTPQDEYPQVNAVIETYNTIDITVQPFSLTTLNSYTWEYVNACYCAEVNGSTYFRNAYPDIQYGDWELDINRSGYNAATGDIYLTNTLYNTSQDNSFVTHLNGSGQSLDVNAYLNNTGKDMEGRQTFVMSNGDVIIASRVQDALLSPRLHVIRKNAIIVWEMEIPASRAPGHLYVTEDQQLGEIILAADLDAVNVTSTTHDLMICRIKPGGGLRYYYEIPVTHNGAQRDNFQVLGLTSTRDGGYAVCGSSGQNNDFISGYVMKFDGTGPTGTLDWQYDFRRQTPGNCYDLNNPGCRSASAFYAIRQLGSNGYYVGGYTSDHDQNGQNATFWNGLLVRLDGSGNELAVREYAGSGWTTFKGMALTLPDIAMAGDIRNPVSGDLTDLFIRIDKATLSVQDAKSYGVNGNSSLLDIYNTASGSGGTGYTMVGSTTDWYNIRTPQVISTDIHGSLDCANEVTLNDATPVNDAVALDLGSYQSSPSGPILTDWYATCVEVFPICPVPSVTASRQPMGVEETLASTAKAAGIKAYPNPASSLLNVELDINQAGMVTISIFDLQGREVMHKAQNAQAGKSHLQLDISGLNRGLYFIQSTGSNGQSFPVQKILKQ